jgi:aryl-alcohol dehydrogenase-like predicted oxidoreductase
MSLAWAVAALPARLPIPGNSSIAHLEENLASASIRLNFDEFRATASGGIEPISGTVTNLCGYGLA